MDTAALDAMTIEELREHARISGVQGAKKLRREQLIETLMDTGTDDAMTRSEERLHVDTRREAAGTARLRKYVETEEVQVSVPLRREEVRLEREPITDENRAAAESGPEISDAEYEVTLYSEQPDVTTETVPVERVRLAKQVHIEEEMVSGEIRKERIEATLPGQEPQPLA